MADTPDLGSGIERYVGSSPILGIIVFNRVDSMFFKKKLCQSCGMPLSKKEEHGTNEDGSENAEYCCYCFQKGKFTQNLTLEEMIEKISDFHDKMNLSKDEARSLAREILPKLKRWKKKNCCCCD